MKTIQHIFQLNLSPKEVVWSKRIMAIVMLPIFMFYMTSMNFLIMGMMQVRAEEPAVEVVADPALAPAEEPASVVKEAAPVVEPAPAVVEPVIEPVVELTPVVETPPTPGVITPEAASTEAVVANSITEVVPVETVTVAEEVPVVKPEWQISEDGKTADIGPVEADVTYKAPQNDKVTVTFTKLPEKAGSLTIEEIKLTAEEQLSLGALSDTAYDITSDMENGTFEYNLTLPYPDKDNDGKAETANGEIKAGELRVLYTEGNEVKQDELKNISEDKDVAKSTSKSGKVIELKGLDHFTIFVVTTIVLPAVDPFCEPSMGGVFSCYNTISAALAAAPESGTIIVKAGTYTDSPTVNKDIILELSGDAVVSGTLTINSGDILTLKQHEHTLTAGAIDNKGGIENGTGDGNIILVASTGDITARTITSVGNVTLTATSGNIFDDPSGNQDTYVSGANITLNAPNGSIGTYNVSPTSIGQFSGALDVHLGSGLLTANAKNDVAITETGDTNVTASDYSLISSTDGSRIVFGNLSTSGDVIVDSVLDGNSSIDLVAKGNIIVNSAVSTSANTASLYAKGSITLNNSITAVDTVTVKSGFDSGAGSIIDDGSQVTTISATNIILNATGSVSNVVPAGNGTINFLNAVDVALGGGTLTSNNGYITETGGARNGTYNIGTGNLSLSKAFSGASTLTSSNGKLTISDTDTSANILVGEYSGAVPSALNTATPFGTYYEVQTEGTINYANFELWYTVADRGALSETKVSDVYYNDGSWHGYGGTVGRNDFDIYDGKITFSSSEVGSIVAGVDIINPTVEITAPLATNPNNNVTASTVITFTDSENTNPQCSVTGTDTDWVSCTNNETTLGNIPQFLALANGAFTLYLKDTDLVGNLGTDNEALINKNDIIAPVVTLNALSPDPNNVKTPTFTGTVSDASSNIASVEYQVDDTINDSWSTATVTGGNYTFTTGILSDTIHTVYIRATDVASAANVSTPVSDTFTIDSIAPTFTMQYYSDSGLNTELNGTGTGPDLKVGTYYIKITSNETLVGTPTVSIASEGTNNNVTGGATTLVSEKNYKYIRTIISDSAAVGVTQENISVTGIDMVDNHANDVNPTNEAAKAAYTDTVNPLITINTKTTNDTTPWLTGTWADANGLDSIGITINDSINNFLYSYSAIVDYNGVVNTWGVHVADALVNGVYNVVAAATDWAGNIGNDTTTNEVSISNVTPNLSRFSSTTGNGNYGIGSTINITAEYDKVLDGGSYLTVLLNTGASVALDNVSGSNISGTYTVASGQNTADLTVTSITDENVIDTFGNSRGDSAVPVNNIGTSKDIVIDGVGPTVAITAPTTGTKVGGTATVSFTDNDLTAAQCSIDNTVWVACTSGVTTLSGITGFDALGEVAFTLYLKDTDAVENVGIDNKAGIIKDTTAPTIAITDNIADGTTANGDVILTFTFSEAVNGFTADDVVVAGGTTGSFTGADGVLVYTLVVVPTAATQTGTITVDVAAGVAKDLALNNNTAATEATQNYDTAAPIITITRTPNQDLFSGNYSIVVTFGDSVSGKEYNLDSAGWLAYPVEGVTVSTEGVHTFDARGIDSAGNTGNATQATFTIDKTKPTIDSILAPVAETAYKTDPALQFTPNDTATAVTCSYKIDGGDPVSVVCTKAVAVNTTIAGLSDGRHSIVITVADSAGNSLDSSPISFVYDNNSTLTVGSGKDFATIQGAINAAPANEIIDVAAGNYPENVQIFSKDGLTIKGAGDATIIGGGANIGYGFEIDNSSNLTIKDLKIITNGPNLHGIYVDGNWVSGRGIHQSNNLTIQNTTISATGGVSSEATGIYADYVTDGANTGWTITGNRITADGGGIGLEDVTNSTVSNNVSTITDGTNILWIAVNSNLSTLVVSDNTVNGSGGSQVAFLTDYNHPGFNSKTITGVTFHGNISDTYGSKALRIGTGVSGVVADHNKFLDADKLAISNESATSVNAESNWWGTAVLATIQTKNTGTVTVEPYYVTVAMDKLSSVAVDTVYVDKTYSDGAANGGHIFGYDAFSTIQDGIDKVATNGTVNVVAGTYDLTSRINITKAVSIIGDVTTPANVVINAPGAGGTEHGQNSVFMILSSDVTIKGFRIQGALHTNTVQNAGIYVDDPRLVTNPGLSNIIISNNEITDNGYGIVVQNIKNSTISNNKIYDNKKVIGKESESGVGIVVYGNAIDANHTNNLTITGNDVYDNETEGIRVDVGDTAYYLDVLNLNMHITISDNHIYNNGSMIADTGFDTYIGIKSAGWSNGVTVTGNEIYGHTGTSINSTSGNAGIQIHASKGWTISDNNIHNNLNGIFFANSGAGGATTGSHTISSNNITANVRGISIDNGSEAVATGNTISGNNSTDFLGIPFLPYGALNRGVVSFDATENWWGSATGPIHSSNPLGIGNAVSDNVSFRPWYLSLANLNSSILDQVAPTPIISSSASPSTGVSPIPMSVDFGENVTGFDANDITVGNGSVTDLSFTGLSGSSSYTFTVTPTAPGTVTVNIVGNVAQDLSGNYSNAATQFSISYDTTPPTVTLNGVNTTHPNGTFTVGENIDIAVTFTKNVNVIGTPRLQMETGATDEYANYLSGTGTSTLTFHYTVATGNTSSDLDYVATDSLAFNGGTIRDAALNGATLTLPAVGTFAGAHAIVIDTTAPTLTTATIVSNHTNTDYARVGSLVTLTIGSSKNIQIPTVTIAGHDIIPTGSNSAWSAAYTMVDGDTEGTIPFSINYSDLTGNAGATVTLVTSGSNVTFDKINPDAPDIRSDEGLWYTNRPTNLDIDFSDSRMLQMVEYKLGSSGTWRTIQDNINSTSRTGNWAIEDADWSAMNQGNSYFLYFSVTDKAGNTYTTPNNTDGFWLRKDTGAPNDPNYNGTEGQTFGSNPMLNIDFSDSWTLDKVEYRVDNSGSWNTKFSNMSGKTYTNDWSLDISGLSNGTHYIYFQITDDAGNIYTTGGDGAGFLFYKNSGSGGISGSVEGAEINGESETPVVEGDGVVEGAENQGMLPSGAPVSRPWLPYAEGVAALLLVSSGAWWWLRRGGTGIGGNGGNFKGMMFSTLKTAASRIRMFLW